MMNLSLNSSSDNEKWAILKRNINYSVSTHGKIKSNITNKLLNYGTNSKGYLQVNLYKQDDSKHKASYKLHRLIAETFIPNPLNLPQINHKDGNKLNNHYTNLEWCTNKYNANHAINNKLIIRNKSIIVTNLDTNERYYFISIRACGRYLNINNGNIVRAIQCKNGIIDNFKFQTEEEFLKEIEYNSGGEKPLSSNAHTTSHETGNLSNCILKYIDYDCRELYSLESLLYPEFSITIDGHVYSNKTHKIVKPIVGLDNYLYVIINRGYCDNNNVLPDTIRIDRLMLNLFNPIPNMEKYKIKHIDGNKQNNHRDNLAWMTKQDHVQEMIKNGSMPQAKCTEEIVHEICRRLVNKKSCVSIGKELNIPFTTVMAIRLGRNWKHISNLYNIPKAKKFNEPISEETVHKICKALKHGISISAVAFANNVSKDIVRHIANGKNWRKISDQYLQFDK